MDRAAVVSRIAHEGAKRAPELVGDGPWWEALDRGFAHRPEPFELDTIDRVVVGATAVSDVLLRTLGATLVGTLAMPIGYNPRQLLALRGDDGEFYRSLADRGDLDAAYPAPPRGVAVKRRRVWRPTYRPKKGEVSDLTFESPFETRNPRLRKSYARHKANRTAHARYWSHGDGPRPTVIAIHGFSADLYFINQWFFAIPWLYKLGCDVLLFTLPFHGPRQTRFSPFSGHGFFAGGVPRINEACAHAVHDLRVFMNWLRTERGAEAIGVTGVSLGGFTSSLLASVDDSLAFAIPNVPVVTLADLVLEWEPIGTAVRTVLNTLNIDLAELRHLLAVSCPLTWPVQLARERLMIIAGVGDRLAPPKHSRVLWDHWGRPRMHWFAGSHLVHLDRGAYLREMARFMASIGFIEPRG